MIHFFLLQNRQGKTRLSKWYTPPENESEKFRMEADIHRLIIGRDRKFTRFVEYGNYKLVYQRYAGLFFSIGCDVDDNELSHLETIHLFVELLDLYFSNVCELDIVFDFYRVFSLLDEFILAGEIEETSKKEIIERVRAIEKLD